MRQNDPTRLDSRVLDGHTDAGFNESMRVTSTHRINRNSSQTIVVREEEKEPDFVDMILGGLMGEFKEDPTFAMIGVDLGVSLVPILDQASDIRDILAHLYYMIFDGQHSSFMRWVALAFTLIGLFPVVGSIIKSASKFVIKGVKEALEYLGHILTLFKNVLPEGSDISKLDAYISSNWNHFVEYAMSAWKSTITKLSGAAKLIRAVSSSIADTIAVIENYAKTMLPRAFEWIKAKWDEILSKGKQKAPRQAEDRAEQLERLSRGMRRQLTVDDMLRFEREGGHTIQRHGYFHNRETLRKRIYGEDPAIPADLTIWQGNQARSASRWIDDDIMRETVSTIINNHIDEIEEAARTGGAFPRLERISVGHRLGEGWLRTSGPNPGVFWFDNMTSVTIVIRSNGKGGWYVHTAYPLP